MLRILEVVATKKKDEEAQGRASKEEDEHDEDEPVDIEDEIFEED